MRYVLRISFVALAVSFAGCIQPSSAMNSSPPVVVAAPTPTPVPVEVMDAPSRTACVTRVLERLIRAFNAGDASELGRIVGSGPVGAQGFQWVSMADAFGRDTGYSPDEARRMMLDRSARGQRLTLTSVVAPAGPSWHGGVDAAVKLESHQAGVVGTTSIHGKTALSCVGERVYVLSLGSED